jgi:hypothetical protein
MSIYIMGEQVTLNEMFIYIMGERSYIKWNVHLYHGRKKLH